MKFEEKFNRLYNLIESKEDIDEFNKKFGTDSYSTFQQYKDRIRKMKDENGKPISLDITYHIKHTPIDIMKKIFERAENREYEVGSIQEMDVENKPIPKPLHTKEQLLLKDFGKYQLYKVSDYRDMIMMSEGTGDGSIGGRKTGWCVGGRYEVPFGSVKVSQAKEFFYKYAKNQDLEDESFLVVEEGDKKYCLMQSGAVIINITDMDDNDHYYDNSEKDETEYYRAFFETHKDMIDFLDIASFQRDFTDWGEQTFIYNEVGKEVPTKVVHAEIKDVYAVEIDAFYMRNKVQTVTFADDKLKQIRSGAFAYCEKIKELNLPDSLERIGEGAFFCCHDLMKINIPEKVYFIGDYAFVHCNALREIKFPKGCHIGKDALYKCKDLKTVYISKETVDKLMLNSNLHLNYDEVAVQHYLTIYLGLGYDEDENATIRILR